MKVQSVSNNYHNNFKANYFTVEKRGKHYNLDKISTDNAEKLGEKPVLQTEMQGADCEFPMVYDGKYYTTKLPSYISKYRIFYKDTGKYEKDGKEQKVNPLDLTKIAVKADRIYNNLSLEHSFAKGEASGKVFVNTFDIPKDIPVILVIDEIKDEEVIFTGISHNVNGVITSSCYFGVLSHVANLTRNRISAMSIIWDDGKYNDLKKLDGKFVTINNENGTLEYKEIEPKSVIIKPQIADKVEAPKLETVERLLNFDELTPQNCGNKGYRLGVMQKLIREGILKDITVPNGFVIPEGYLNKYKEYINVEDKEEWKNRIVNGIYTQDTENKIKELGLPRRNLLVRSNFNTEDLDSFSSAGIYHSKQASTFGSIMLDADEIVECSIDEEYNLIAKKEHTKHGIQDSDVQPSVIVQEYIHPEYSFTLYTDDGEDNLIIDLSDARLGYLNPGNSIIRYNRKTKELIPERILSPIAEYTLNEKGEIIDQKRTPSRVDEDWDILKPIFGIVTSGALALEKFFKKPQDIEGGIKDGKVYFWQTRDIVAKAVKRI